MQARSIVEETLKDVERFRLLCVGNSGDWKALLINRVFGLETWPSAAPVGHWTPGHADIDQEFTSPENNYFILHDCKGFDAGSDDVERFIRQRCDSNLPLKDQLHAIWLLKETPIIAGRRVFETRDERLLLLAHETRIPVIIVFTSYDLSVRVTREVLQEEEEDSDLSRYVLHERSNKVVQGTINKCIQVLEHTLRTTNMPKPHHVIVAGRLTYYKASISTLVQVTCDLVSDKLKLIWAIAQRASRHVKINASVDVVMEYLYPRGLHALSVQPMPLRGSLRRVHEDIITCWNLMSEKTTLSSDEFKQLMLYLVEDVQKSQNYYRPYIRLRPLALDKIFTFLRTARSTSIPSNLPVMVLTSSFEDWLSSAFMDNRPQVQHLFMAYTADLITMLKSLPDVVKPSSLERTMWSEPLRVFQACKPVDLSPIHQRVCVNFRLDRQISDVESFRHEFHALLGGEPLLSSSERNETIGRRKDPPNAPVGPATPRGSSTTSRGGPGTSRIEPVISHEPVTSNGGGPLTSATSQRATQNREVKNLKIRTSVDIAMATMGYSHFRRAPNVRPVPLRDCLGRIHEDIVTCWDFRDEEKTISSDGFKQLMLYLVQDVQESQNQDGPYVTPPLEVDKISTFFGLITARTAPFPPATAVISLKGPFLDWLWSAVLDNEPSVQRLLMAYTAYLVTVLKSLFDIVESSSPEGTMWLKLRSVFQEYGRLDPREQVHRRIRANFQHDGPIGDPVSFRRALCALLEHEPPRSGSECVGWNTQDTGASPASLPSTGEHTRVTVPSLGVSTSLRGEAHAPSPVVSAQSSGGPAPSPVVPAPSPASGGHEESDIYYKALGRKYRKLSNNRRTHARRSSVPRPDWDLPDTDSDSEVENDDSHENYEERFFDVDSNGGDNGRRSIKTMSKQSISTYSLVSTTNSITSTTFYDW